MNAFARLLAWLLRGLAATWRVREHGALAHRDATVGPRIGALWHGGLLIAAWAYRDRSVSVAVSRSSDGERISAVLRALGYAEPVRGSSSRGGSAALRELVSRVRGGAAVAVLCDGPRGPARRAKPGVVALARLAEVPITPVGFRAQPCIRLGSWDRTCIPLPFARVDIRYGEPLEVPGDAGRDDEEQLLAALDRRLDALEGGGDEA